jgi:predicted SAM-dependent methyltransferase
MMLNLGCGTRLHAAWVNVDLRPLGPGIVTADLRLPLAFGDSEFDVVYHSHLLEHLSKRAGESLLRECHRVLKPEGIIRVVVPDLEQIVRLYLASLEQARNLDTEAENRYEWILLEMFDQMVRNQSGGEMLKYWKQNPMPAEAFVIQRVGSEVLDTLRVLRTNLSADVPKQDDGVVESDPFALGRFRVSGEVHQWMYDSYSLAKLLIQVGFQNPRMCRADESSIPDFNSYLLDIEPDGSVRKPDSLFMEAFKA